MYLTVLDQWLRQVQLGARNVKPRLALHQGATDTMVADLRQRQVHLAAREDRRPLELRPVVMKTADRVPPRLVQQVDANVKLQPGLPLVGLVMTATAEVQRRPAPLAARNVIRKLTLPS